MRSVKYLTLIPLLFFIFGWLNTGKAQDCLTNENQSNATVIFPDETLTDLRSNGGGELQAHYDGSCYGSTAIPESGGTALTVYGFEVVADDTSLGVPSGEEFDLVYYNIGAGVIESITAVAESGESDPFIYQHDDFWTISEIHQNPIPVELISFNGVLDNNKVLLSWCTASETNNSGFEIQRKTVGSFHKIGFKSGNGTTNSESCYEHVDYDDQKKYPRKYRLKQIDLDGSVEYSQVIEVERSYITKVNSVFPNPSSRYFSVKFQLAESADVSFKVFDLIGRKILEHRSKFQSGSNTQRIEISSYSSGIYLLHISGGSLNTTEKITFVK